MAQGDMFLKIKGARQGAIKGESQDAKHKDEIDILSWSWGMEGNVVHGAAAIGAKRSVSALKLTKRVDCATTGLMSCMRANELIEATLTVRKAGGPDAVEYFKIVVEQARITRIFAFSGAGADPAILDEELSIAFNKITVEYRQQGSEGLSRGASSFEDNISEHA